jgi:hypothetical protein
LFKNPNKSFLNIIKIGHLGESPPGSVAKVVIIQNLISEALLHTKVIRKVSKNSQFWHNRASTA